MPSRDKNAHVFVFREDIRCLAERQKAVRFCLLDKLQKTVSHSDSDRQQRKLHYLLEDKQGDALDLFFSTSSRLGRF